MNRPRLTIRYLMAGVAVVALALGVEIGRRRATTYLWLARLEFHEASFYQEHARLWARHQNGGCMVIVVTTPADFDTAASKARHEGDLHEQRARDYERAAWRPWIILRWPGHYLFGFVEIVGVLLIVATLFILGFELSRRRRWGEKASSAKDHDGWDEDVGR